MFLRTGQNRIVAIACVALCLVVKVSGAADAKRENDGDEWSSLRKAVLARFDINHNGRLDSKEKAKAYRELTSRDDSDDGLNTLRDNLLARFDKNGNGKLERSEVRTALVRLNLKPQVAGAGQLSASMAPTESFSDRNRAAANDPTAAVALAAQQLTTTGIDSATAQELAIQRFDLNGDSVLDQSELALAQAMALRELATLASPGATTTSLPLATTISTGTTGTGTTSTGTSTSGMSGGCSGSGSGGGSGSSGASGSNGSSSTTNSAALPANNQGFGSPSFANFGARGFGGGRGR